MALEKMSNRLNSLSSLVLSNSSGQEIDFVLKNLLENNRPFLKKLEINECEELSRFPDKLWGLVSLEELEIWNCPNLSSFPDIIEEDTGGGLIYHLRDIRIFCCNKLNCLPNGLRNLTSLERLDIVACPNLMGINPSDMCSLKSLQWLSIADCGIQGTSSRWPEWLFSLTNLEALHIGGFSEELDYFPWPSSSTASFASTANSRPLPLDHLLVSLKFLVLRGWPKLKSLPDQLQHLTPLAELVIVEFSGLEVLSDWLGNLSSLEVLSLRSCKNLMHFPSVDSMRRLTKLSSLDIHHCPLLAERCKRGSGPEWNKIAHIPSIEIDEKYIQRKS